MNVLSLFDGMACGMIALKQLGINVENYYSYEVDKYAIKTAWENFPEIKPKGNVFYADFSKYHNIDLLIGGSPCTYWSIAQSTDKRETTASGIGWELFSQYVKALRETKPKLFLYENNKSMSEEIYNSISNIFGFEPIMINSALVSAQTRRRYYWCGKRDADGAYRKVNVPQPSDRGILLRDILDCKTDREKSRTVLSSIGRTTTREYFQKNQNTLGFVPIRVGAFPKPNGELSESQGMRVYSDLGKSVNVTAGGGGLGGKSGLCAIPCELSTCKENHPVYQVKSGKIEIKGKQYPIKLADGYYVIRKLTVKECMRLQTVPEWYEFPVSDSQAYKMLGNGWTVEVIMHLLRYMVNSYD